MLYMILSLRTELSLRTTADLLALTSTPAPITCLSSPAGAIPHMARIPAAATIASHANVSNSLSLPWPLVWTCLCQLCGCCSVPSVQAQPDRTPQWHWLSRPAVAQKDWVIHEASEGDSLPAGQTLTAEPEDGNKFTDKWRALLFLPQRTVQKHSGDVPC